MYDSCIVTVILLYFFIGKLTTLIVRTQEGVRTLRTLDISDPRQFGTSAEVSLGHFCRSVPWTLRPLPKMLRQFGTSAELSQRHFGTIHAPCTTHAMQEQVLIIS